MTGFIKGKTFELRDDWKKYYDEQDDGFGNTCLGYHYAKPANYIMNGNYIADCWIINEKGKVHPGFNVSPVPLNFDSVVHKNARRKHPTY